MCSADTACGACDTASKLNSMPNAELVALSTYMEGIRDAHENKAEDIIDSDSQTGDTTMTKTEDAPEAGTDTKVETGASEAASPEKAEETIALSAHKAAMDDLESKLNEKHSQALSEAQDEVEAKTSELSALSEDVTALKADLFALMPETYKADKILSTAANVIDGYDSEAELEAQSTKVLSKFVKIASAMAETPAKETPEKAESANAGAEETDAAAEEKATQKRTRTNFRNLTDRISRVSN